LGSLALEKWQLLAPNRRATTREAIAGTVKFWASEMIVLVQSHVLSFSFEG
jgi:hypothetical protein